MVVRLWADVYDASGNRLGDGPVALRDASIKRVLDGVGSVAVTVPGTDARAISLLVNENRIRIYYRPTDAAATRELGRGIVRVITAQGTTSDFSISADGPDDLDELTRRSTLLGRKFSGQTTSAIVNSLTALVSGWSASTSGGNTTDARFDGLSVWKALLGLAAQQGLHVRSGSSARTIEVGAFGGAATLRLVNPMQAMRALDGNDDVALIESIAVEKNSEAVATRLYPLGAGIGEAWLTLEDATRSSPYTVQSTTGPDGSTQYYLQDTAGAALYGTIEKVGKFSSIAPLSNSAADMENAANALYDISAAWLQRFSQRQDVYSVTCRKVRQLVRPGDKVRLVYNGVIERDGLVVNYLDVDADMWVLEVTERVGVEGGVLDLKLATVDRHELDAAQIVIGTLEELQIDGVSVKPYFNRVDWVYSRLIDPFNYATVPVKLTNATQRLNRCLLRFKTQSFVATSSPTLLASGDGGVFKDVGDTSEAFTWQPVGIWSPGADNGVDDPGLYVTALLPLAVDGLTGWLPLGSIDNFLTLQYFLQGDTQTPTGIHLYIDGVDETSGLGGPWAPSGGAVTVDLDITDIIVANPPLQQEHTVQLRCTSGQGEVEFTIEIYETIQSIRVT